MKLQNWITWHRTLGFIATLFVLMLTVTGLLLNHTGDLKLDQIYIENSILLDWYGLAPESAPVSYQADGHWLTQLDDHLYLDDIEITGNTEHLRGAVKSGDIIILAFAHSLYLLTQTGDLVEKVTGMQGVPGGLQGIGVGPDGEVLVRSDESVYATDLNMSIWKPYPQQDGNWSDSEKIPAVLEKKLLHMYRGKGLSMEKLLVDLHSGRILGKAGALLVDLAAVLFIILAISGWCVWLKRKSIQKQINGKPRPGNRHSQ